MQDGVDMGSIQDALVEIAVAAHHDDADTEIRQWEYLTSRETEDWDAVIEFLWRLIRTTTATRMQTDPLDLNQVHAFSKAVQARFSAIADVPPIMVEALLRSIHAGEVELTKAVPGNLLAEVAMMGAVMVLEDVGITDVASAIVEIIGSSPEDMPGRERLLTG